MRASKGGLHISGAEGIFTEDAIPRRMKDFYLRAIHHERGKPSEIHITATALKSRPIIIKTLPLITVETKNPADAIRTASSILSLKGISKDAIDLAINGIFKGHVMRGAMIVDAEDAIRLEPDRQRGVRASMLGIKDEAYRILSKRLSRLGINNVTVRDALILASKVASHLCILGELCVSDDPTYTTGYVATGDYGYIRLPNIKRYGLKKGGRAFFIKKGTNIKKLVEYLEETPAMVGEVSECRATITMEEFSDILDRKPCSRKGFIKKDCKGRSTA